jgi:hypothetical protein
MAHTQQTEIVRCLVAQAFSSRGAPSCGHLRESILIRGGVYCGRRFDAEGERYAVWFADEDEIALYNADGSVAGLIEIPVAEVVHFRAAA